MKVGEDMRMKKILAICAALVMIISLIGCGNNEYSAVEPEVVEEIKASTEKARAETEEEAANRARQQLEIAQAKAEAQKQYQNYELVMNEGVGEVLVASSTRQGINIPTYIYFPKNYDSETTYPMVIMYAGFAADHNNGTRFDDITKELTDTGIMVVQFDIPGYGKSEETNLAYTLTNVKHDSLDVISYAKNNFNIGKVGAFGYDVGGRVVMEMQVDKLYDFDQIELLGPYSNTDEFIHACFGDKAWGELKAKAKDQGLAKYGVQEYSLQWFTDWEEKEDTLFDDFCKIYKKRRFMLVYSIIDDCVDPLHMEKMYKAIGGAAICLTDTGHDLGVRGFDTPKQTTRVVREQSVEFWKSLID